MATTTTDQILSKDDIAKLQTLIPGLGDVVKRFPELMTEFEAMKATFGEFDPVKVKAAVEKIEADTLSITEAIRKSKNGMYVPGLEDEAKNFSLLRAYRAKKMGSLQKHAPFEFEAIKAANEKFAGDIKNTINTLVESEGGSFVPDQLIPDVIGAIYKRSAFIKMQGASLQGESRVRVLDGLTGSPAKLNRFNGGMIAYWRGQNQALIRSKIETGSVVMTPKKLTCLAVMSDEAIRFPSFGLEQMFRQDLINAMAQALDTVIPYGAGTDEEPRGLVNMFSKGVKFYDASTGAIATTVPTAGDNTGGELDFDGLDNMQGSVEDSDLEIGPSWAFISAPRYWRRLKRIKVDAYAAQTTGQAYLLGMPMISDARLQQVVGNLDKSTKIASGVVPGASAGWPTNETDQFFGDVFAGNWNEALLARWFGLEIVDDGGASNFINDQVAVKSRMYADFNVREEKNFVICPNAQMRDV